MNRKNGVKRKSTGSAIKSRNKEAKQNSGSSSPLLGWTPYPTVKLLVGPTEEVILIHRKIIKDLNLYCSEKSNPVSIPIPNVDPQCLRVLLNYIYNDEMNISVDNVWKILVTCWQFSHTDAQLLCIDYIVDNIMRFDCWEMWRSAKMYDLNELVAAVENYASRQLELLKTGLSFLQLSCDELLQFFQSDEVCRSSSREIRCQAAITWIEHDIDEREKYISTIMTEVKFQSLPDPVQNRILAKHPKMAKNSQYIELCKQRAEKEDNNNSIRVAMDIFDNNEPDICIEDMVVKIELEQDLGREILKWPTSEDLIILDSDSDEDLSMPILQSELSEPPPTLSSGTLVVISGKEENGYRSVWSYNVDTKRKTFLSNAEARKDDAYLCRNNVLYHLGGRKGDIVTKDVYALKLAERQLWEPCPQMTVNRCHFSALVMKGDIYAIGGNIGEGDLVMNAVDRLKFDGEIRSNAWESIAFLNRSRDAYGVTVDDENTIYVVGGCGQPNKLSKCSTVLPLVEEYPGPNGLWISSRRLIEKRMFHGVVFLGGYIYAIGGFDGKKVLSSVECFDGNCTGKWIKCAPMLTPRKEMSTVVLKNKIYVFGGKGDDDQPLLSSEEYDPITKRWSHSDILPENEGPFHSVLVIS